MADVREENASPRNPVKAIRLKCRDCTNNQITEIDNCPVKQCALYPFRFGKNPYREKRELSEEQKKAAGERLKNARFAKSI